MKAYKRLLNAIRGLSYSNPLHNADTARDTLTAMCCNEHCYANVMYIYYKNDSTTRVSRLCDYVYEVVAMHGNLVNSKTAIYLTNVDYLSYCNDLINKRLHEKILDVKFTLQ